LAAVGNPDRVWFSDVASQAANTTEAIGLLLEAAGSDANTIRRQVVVESSQPLPALVGGQGNSAQITTETPTEIIITVTAAEAGWLVLAESDYPGWQATIDGEAANIYRANVAFRAVYVPAGSREVRFVYSPRWLQVGALVSGLALLLCLALAGWAWRPNAKRTQK
jgi:uncharacterized membrane protein YfhO